MPLGARIADAVADFVGSWPFIIGQSVILAGWIALNIAGIVHFDLYPFILLNLFLSFQAAYTGPFVLMSQNRQAAKDRATQEADYEADLDAETTIKMIAEQLTRLQAQLDRIEGARQ